MAQIALVVLDTLRKDVFDEYFSWLPGVHYQNAWSTSHWTVPAHASLFTGEYPSEIGVYARQNHLDCDTATLAEQLSQAGYKTLGFSANVHITDHYNFDRGFGIFEKSRFAESDEGAFPWGNHTSNSPLPEPLAAVTGLAKAVAGDYDTATSLNVLQNVLKRRNPTIFGDESTSVSYAIEFLENSEFDPDTFVFLNLMEMHAPYVHPSEYSSQQYSTDDLSMGSLDAYLSDVRPSDYETQWRAYQDTAAYLSDQYRDLSSLLSEFDCVITLADHGEMFGEAGVAGHTYGVHPHLVHIPLVVSNAADATTKTGTPVNLQNVHSTILDIAGIDPTGKAPPLSSVEKRNVRTEYHGIRYEEMYDIIREQLGESAATKFDRPLFGLATDHAYIYEKKTGVTVSGNGQQTELQQKLESVKETILPLSRNGDEEVADDVRENLDQLGYL